jgi:hypothetical protein
VIRFHYVNNYHAKLFAEIRILAIIGHADGLTLLEFLAKSSA